jgi:hypothetical protein
MQGLLSERAVHFTPAFLLTQAAPVVGSIDADSDEHLEIKMAWFERSQRSIEIELIGLAVAHINILDLLDECLDGVLGRDEEWSFGRKAVGAIARKLASDLGFDRIAEEFERRMASDAGAEGDAS